MKSRREKIINEILFWRECKEYELSIWVCPNFLFLIMGVLTVTGMLATYELSQRFETGDLAGPLVAFVTLIIFVPGSIIVKSFEKMANANKMKTEFVSIVSHQLRSPSSAIKWTLNLLMENRLGEFTEKQHEYLVLMRENNERMIKLVNDLLNISRIEKGELVLKKNKLNIADLIEKIVKSLSPFAKLNNVELKIEPYEDANYMVWGDDVYLGVVINNLVDNAIRYSINKGDVKIRISLTPDKNIKIEVEDNGVGIPMNEQSFIFQKFFRAKNVVKYQSKGTGLGLFMAKSIIEQMGGHIGFESKEGDGTIFWFDVPTKKPKNKRLLI